MGVLKLKLHKTKWLIGCLILTLAIFLTACSEKEQTDIDANAETSTEQVATAALKNNITLSVPRGFIGDTVDFNVSELAANKDAELVWNAIDGEYVIEDLYAVIGPKFTEREIVIASGKTDANGNWSGQFSVPEGFGGDFTVWVKQDGEKIGQVAYTVDPRFVMEPESGPVGTEIKIKVEGLGWSTYMRNWQLTYDNKYTGLITAISTNGTAEAKIRAAGEVGKHAIRIRTGYLGMQYINYKQSPYPDKPAPDFLFEITEGVSNNLANHVEEIPVAAGGGLEMPALKNQKEVTASLSIDEGIVGEPVTLTAAGLPANTEIDLVWNTMRGSRVSGKGFGGESSVLTTVKTDANGAVNYDFVVPDDLGGIPHRIDLAIDEDIYAQTYLRILPSIVEFSPKSGPVGTVVTVTIKGGGWTEYDNAYYLNYDNAYTGYLCAFNSNGDLTFDFVATGHVGHHVVDLYPGIYKQEELSTDMTLIPQLTYSTDHPGSAMPAIRLSFEVTK